MRIMFDTNILIHYIRQTAIMEQVEQMFDPFAVGQQPILCVVAVGEIRSIALQAKWGDRKLLELENLISKFLIADIRAKTVLAKYAEIDAYSQNNHPTLPSPFSPRNMGKNDLWIASAATVLKATLLTTDKDFDHLDKAFLDLQRLEVL